jgi:hypothetical protein
MRESAIGPDLSPAEVQAMVDSGAEGDRENLAASGDRGGRRTRRGGSRRIASISAIGRARR